MRKILYVNDQYERGGAGRVAAILANQLFEKGYEIVLVHDFLNWESTYKLNEKIPKKLIITKNFSRNNFSKIKLWCRCIFTIRKYIKEEKPDLIIATQSIIFLCCYIANFCKKVPIIAADHTSFSRKISPLIDFVRYYLYDKAQAISILTEKDLKLLGDKFPKKQVIYNPLSFPVLKNNTQRKKRILSVGRLDAWKIKGFDIIIKIWSELANDYPDWTLEIAGPGNEDSCLFIKEMIDKYHIKSCVLLGQVDNMKDLYSSSEIFALSSRVEGFPMVLMEALSQGCSCVAFEVGGATNEMIEEGSGILVKDGDVASFKAALVRLMENDELRRYYSKNALQTIERFSVERFVDSWEKLINKVL